MTAFETGTTHPESGPEGALPDQRDWDETRSMGAIVSDISSSLSDLVHQELDLAKAELKVEATTAAKGAGMFGGAGVAGFLTLFFLTFALIYGLGDVMPLGVAALIAGLLWGAAAAALALIGKNRIHEVNPQLPKTAQTLKEDVQWAKAQKN
ncbi:MAG: hypothetical protein JWQ32_563 [Marmoricola sp.]|nr:hypothetical protein [Marmoricola sp.]